MISMTAHLLADSFVDEFFCVVDEVSLSRFCFWHQEVGELVGPAFYGIHVTIYHTNAPEAQVSVPREARPPASLLGGRTGAERSAAPGRSGLQIMANRKPSLRPRGRTA